MAEFNILNHLAALTPDGGVNDPKGDNSFHCPACEAPNFKVNIKTGKWGCFSCDCAANESGKRKIREALSPAINPNAKPERVKSHRAWPYYDAAGNFLFTVHRWDDPDGDPEWFKDGRCIRQTFSPPENNDLSKQQWKNAAGQSPSAFGHLALPYGLKEAQQALADGAPHAFWVEGEPCVDAMRKRGLYAVTSLGGAGKFKPDRDRGLLPADLLVVAPDRDQCGLKHAETIAAAYPGCQWLYAFPGTPQWNGSCPQTKGLDVADWIAQGATTEQILSGIGPKQHGQQKPAAQPSGEAQGKQQTEPRRRSELLEAALDAAEEGDTDTGAELAAELMGRFRMTASHVQGALIKLLTQRYSANGSTPAPGYVDIEEVEHLDHLAPGFIAAREQTLLYAPKGTGKTLAALAIARAVVMGQGLLDRSETATPGRVLYLATDSGCESMHTQMQELGLLALPEFRSGPGQRFFIRGHHGRQRVSAWEATIPEILWLMREIESQQFDLVIIDSVKACLSLTEIEYTDNRAVGALLTLFQRVIAPRAAVLWLHHDGRESGHNGGAKAWAELPVMVHRLEKVEPPKEGPRCSGEDSQGPPPAVAPRRWFCVKSRISGDERSFTYSLQPSGQFEVAPEVEIVGNCRDAVLAVMRQAAVTGQEALHYSELVSRVTSTSGRSNGTIKNTITRMRRGKTPDLRSTRDGRWTLTHHAKTKEPLLSAVVTVTKREKNLVLDKDLESHTPSHTVTIPCHTPSHTVTPAMTGQNPVPESDSHESVTVTTASNGGFHPQPHLSPTPHHDHGFGPQLEDQLASVWAVIWAAEAGEAAHTLSLRIETETGTRMNGAQLKALIAQGPPPELKHLEPF